MTNSLKFICHQTETTYMTRENCKGFQVYDRDYFFSKFGLGDAFDENPKKVKEIFRVFENASLMHMSNTLSRGYKVYVGKTQAYALFAELYCPRVYNKLALFF